MKKMLLLLLFAICTIGYRGETIMQMLGVVKTTPAPQSYSIQSLTIATDKRPRAACR